MTPFRGHRRRAPDLLHLASATARPGWRTQDQHPMQKTPPDLPLLRWRGSGCKSGAEGIRTPDPLTARTARYA
jgi:hypothetical protein